MALARGASAVAAAEVGSAAAGAGRGNQFQLPDVRLPVLKALGVDVSAKPGLTAPGQERRFIH